jgi:hypothetical protein
MGFFDGMAAEFCFPGAPKNADKKKALQRAFKKPYDSIFVSRGSEISSRSTQILLNMSLACNMQCSDSQNNVLRYGISRRRSTSLQAAN